MKTVCCLTDLCKTYFSPGGLIVRFAVSQRQETSRGRPKWAPYLRLKNNKRTSKCQSIGEFGTFYEKKKLKKSLTMPKEKNLKGDPLVSSGIVCYAGNLIGSVPWANRYNLPSSQNFVELLVELFRSLQAVLMKH